MPIATIQVPLKSQLATSLKLGRAAKQDLVSLSMVTALAALVPAGLFPIGLGVIPLMPAGFAACKTQMKTALSMGRGANPSLVAQQISVGLSILCPIVPPAGLAALTSQIANALRMGRSATPNSVANIISQAIVLYYTAGMVI